MTSDGTTITAASMEERVDRALRSVMDPEIPACSIVDLGMVERAKISGDAVEVDLLPTFIGCPAKDLIGEDVTRALDSVAGGREIRVRFVHDPPWTTACITEKGKARLREFGIAPHWDRPSGPTPSPR